MGKQIEVRDISFQTKKPMSENLGIAQWANTQKTSMQKSHNQLLGDRRETKFTYAPSTVKANN